MFKSCTRTCVKNELEEKIEFLPIMPVLKYWKYCNKIGRIRLSKKQDIEYLSIPVEVGEIVFDNWEVLQAMSEDTLVSAEVKEAREFWFNQSTIDGREGERIARFGEVVQHMAERKVKIGLGFSRMKSLRYEVLDTALRLPETILTRSPLID
jgi:hypothetical protein